MNAQASCRDESGRRGPAIARDPESGRPPETRFSPQGLAARARTIAELARRIILGITGPPGAGKSTIAIAIGAVLGLEASVIPMDGFHFSNAVLASLDRGSRKGAPDTFDVDGYAALLGRVRCGENGTVYVPSFSRDLDEPLAGDLAVPPATRIVLTEGNYLLLQRDGWERVRPLLDEVWYVDVDQALRLERLTSRHRIFGKDDAAARAWATGPDEANARAVAALRATADLVIRY